MSTMTEEREAPTGPPPAFGDPEQAFAWVPVTHAAPAPEPADDAETRSEAPEQPRSHRKHIGAIGAAGGIVGGVALWQAYGIVGLLAAGGAAAGLVAAPVAAYALYKRRGRNRTGMGRSRRGQGPNRRNAMSRLGSTGIGRGRGLKLGGGRAPKLGGRGGPKLGGRGKGLLGGKGPKLGGGKSGLGLSRGKSPKLGGGRGSGLGGKLRSSRKGAGLGLAGGKSRSRTTTANRSGGLPGRARRGGLTLGKRGGKAARGAVGRWAKSTGGGAGILSRKAAAAARRRAANAAQRAANTRAGRSIGKAVQAAKQAHSQSAGKSPFARWRAATRAAHASMPKYGRPYTNWAMGVGAGVLALLALLEQRFKAWKAKRNPQAANATKTTNTDAPTGSTSTSGTSAGSDPRFTSSTTHEDTYRRPSGGTNFTPPQQPWEKPPTIRVEVIREEPVPPKALTAPLRALGPGPAETDRKESPMSFPLLDAAMEFASVAMRYQPPNAHYLAPEFDLLPEVMAHLAAGFRNYAQRINAEEPIEQPVNDALFELFNTINQLKTPAEQVGPLHRKVHAHDIARVENPRPNEDRWDVRQ